MPLLHLVQKSFHVNFKSCTIHPCATLPCLLPLCVVPSAISVLQKMTDFEEQICTASLLQIRQSC